MMERIKQRVRKTSILLVLMLVGGNAIAQPVQKNNHAAMDPDKARVVEHWTQERMENAIPRDLVIDAHGLAYLRMPNGFLEPYGHGIAAQANAADRKPLAKPSGGDTDTKPPAISNMDPDGGEIGSSYTFSAKVTDDSGVKSVSFTIRYPDDSTTQKFTASEGADYIWSVSLQGFSAGDWSWKVVAKDKASKGGNTGSTDWVSFTVSTGGGDGGGDGGDTSTDTITNAEWTGGVVQNAAGRLYFEMPKNGKWKGPWAGYVCSATVVDDYNNDPDTDKNDRSVILTAAHCVYDDVNKAFARNVLFIPNQAGTSVSGTDLDCSNDPLGCWVPSFGVVDYYWTITTFPDNIPWDYAHYVVSNTGAHEAGFVETDTASLEREAGDMVINFGAPVINDGADGKNSPDFTHALGYSYSEDPEFRYCAEDMTTEGLYNWWLESCELSGGSSGGPWVQKMGEFGVGDGPVISVNSWGYTTSSGMAGPVLFETSAECVFDEASLTEFSDVPTAEGKAGIAVCK